MVYISREYRFTVHCSEVNAPYLELAMHKCGICPVSRKLHVSKLMDHELCSVFYECIVSEKKFNEFVEYLNQHVKFNVYITIR